MSPSRRSLPLGLTDEVLPREFDRAARQVDVPDRELPARRGQVESRTS